MHNEGNSTYQGTSAFSAVPGVNNDTSGGTQAPADNTQLTQPPANNSGGDNSDSTPAHKKKRQKTKAKGIVYVFFFMV